MLGIAAVALIAHRTYFARERSYLRRTRRENAAYEANERARAVAADPLG